MNDYDQDMRDSIAGTNIDGSSVPTEDRTARKYLQLGYRIYRLHRAWTDQGREMSGPARAMLARLEKLERCYARRLGI